MTTTYEISKNSTSIVGDIISWQFGGVVLAAGILNTFWGQPAGFGIFLILLSFVYFLPVNTILNKMFGFTFPKMGMLKILLAIFIIWAVLGVGELFNKIELMRHDIFR